MVRPLALRFPSSTCSWTVMARRLPPPVSACRCASVRGSGVADSRRPARFHRTTGKDFALPADLEPLAPYKDKLAIFSGFDVKLDGVPNKPHITGCLGLRTGMPVAGEVLPADLRYNHCRSDRRRHALPFGRSQHVRHQAILFLSRGRQSQPSGVSALALYQRLFGEGSRIPTPRPLFPTRRRW